MDKKLQDLVWQVLPKEFKEEVKFLYKSEYVSDRGYQPTSTMVHLDSLFGNHNLTSDADGEEMLSVSRKRVQGIYKQADSLETCNALDALFGSKCLPDAHEENFTSKDELNEDNFAKSEPIYHIGQKVVYKKKGTIKIITDIDSVSDETGTSYYYDTKDANGNNALQFHEAELVPYEEPTEKPKFKVGQYAMMKGKKVEIVGYKSGYLCPYRVHVLTENYGTDVMESDLEPYVESIPSNSGELKSQLPDSQLRLKIAAMAMQGLLASPVDANMQSKSVNYITDASFEYADALISKNKKGGLNENN